MADKTIGELKAITAIYSDSLIPLEQNGEACKGTGAQIAAFAKETVEQYVESAVNAAETATDASNTAQSAAINAAAALVEVNSKVTDAANYAAVAKKYADAAAGSAGGSTVSWGWDSEGYWSVFVTQETE